MSRSDGERISHRKCLSVGFKNTLCGQTTERAVTRPEIAHNRFRYSVGKYCGFAPGHPD
jgi:hypothetical protein